jgi:hypothetical protein
MDIRMNMFDRRLNTSALLLSLEHEERKGVRKDSIIVGGKRKLWGRRERHFISGGRKRILLLEGSQEMPTCPSKDRMKVKTVGW